MAQEARERSVAVPVVTFPYWSSKHTETAGCRFCFGCYAAEEFRSAGGAPLFRRNCSRHGGVAPLDLPATVLLALGDSGGGTGGALTGGAFAGGGCGGVHGWRVGISCARCWCDGVRSRPGSRLMDLDLFYMESTLRNVSLCKGGTLVVFFAAFSLPIFTVLSVPNVFLFPSCSSPVFGFFGANAHIFHNTRCGKSRERRMPGGIGLP